MPCRRGPAAAAGGRTHVYVDRPVVVGTGYDSCGEPVYHYDPWGGDWRHRYSYGDYGYGHRTYYRTHYESPFPVNTAVGAGIGAIVSGRRHRGRGAAIGAGVGLLFDLARWGR